MTLELLRTSYKHARALYSLADSSVFLRKDKPEGLVLPTLPRPKSKQQGRFLNFGLKPSVAPIARMSENEKEASDIFVEKITTTPPQDKDFPAPGSQERLLAERRLVRKLDMRLIPTIFVIYIMNYIDVRPPLLFFLSETIYISCLGSVMVLPLHD